jgi:two-component system OmpR family response regulator
MGDVGWQISTAETAAAGRRMMRDRPDAVLLDYLLPDGNGVELGIEFHKSAPQAPVIVMTGVPLPPKDEALCEENGFPVLRKPFLVTDVMRRITEKIR